ncbi:hypothetical protein [Vibrio sp. 10N.261.46.A3]|uniref:hypothetical protein n=1 Tax=Vibrio sp. 10N.261.46.A3 TaxID=3229658 RepID=UPI003551788F
MFNGRDEKYFTEKSRVSSKQIKETSKSLLDIFKPNDIQLELLSDKNRFDDAYSSIQPINRLLSKSTEQETITLEARCLPFNNNEIELIVANGGAGKSSVLWALGSYLLQETEYIPIYIAIRDFSSIEEVNNFVKQSYDGCSLKEISKFENIVFLFDGVSELSGGIKQDSEIRKLLSLVNESKVVMTSRPINFINDVNYWKLNLLTSEQVSDFMGLYGLPTNIDLSLGELLSYPLMLILYISSDESLKIKAELLQEYFYRITSDFNSTSDLLFSLSTTSLDFQLNSKKNSWSSFELSFKSNFQKNTNEKFTYTINNLGIFCKRNGALEPIHDLYWEWLVGCGLFFKWNEIKNEFVRDFKLRHSAYVSLGSSLIDIPDENELIEIIDYDITIASNFIPFVKNNRRYNKFLNRFDSVVNDNLKSEVNSDIYRAIESVYLSKRNDKFDDVLTATKKLISHRFNIHGFYNVISIDFLWANRRLIEERLKFNDDIFIIMNVICSSGQLRWATWIEELYLKGHVQFNEALRVYFSCSDQLPKWISNNLTSFLSDRNFYFIRSAADRGRNKKLAYWLYNNFEKIIIEFDKYSGFWDVTNVLIKCGDRKLFELIALDFYNMSEKNKQHFTYAFEKIDSKWISSIKYGLLTSDVERYIKSRLFCILVNEFSDEELECWVNSEDVDCADLGWKALAERKGITLLSRIVRNMPESFAGLHMIPTLRALTHIENLPESVAPELMSRIGSPMQPMATESFILAMANIKPHGILNVFRMVKNQPYIFGTYHFECFLKEFLKWSKLSGIRIMADFDNQQINIIDYFIYLQLIKENNDEINEWIRISLEYSESDLVMKEVSNVFICHPDIKLNRVKAHQFDEVLYNAVIDRFGIEGVYKLYKENLSLIPCDDIVKIFRILSEKSKSEFNSFIYDLSRNPRVENRSYFNILIESSLLNKLIDNDNLNYYCEIMSVLEEEKILDILAPHQDTPIVIDLIRCMESKLGRLLITESANRLS